MSKGEKQKARLDPKEKRIVGSDLIKMKLEKSEVDEFFSPIARSDPNYVYEGG